MPSTQEVYRPQKREKFISTGEFRKAWDMPEEIVMTDKKGFIKDVYNKLDKFDKTFLYHHPIVHDTLLNEYLNELIKGDKVKISSSQKGVVKEFKEVVKKGKLNASSRMLHKFHDQGEEYEVDALLYFYHKNKNYTVMVDFKSNGEGGRDIERFKKTGLYKKLRKKGAVYTVIARPNYKTNPATVRGNITEFYTRKNLKEFISHVRLETHHDKKRRLNFNRNLNHNRQNFRPSFR